MNLSSLMPVGAVIVGWFLNELAGAFRIAREERHCLRAALPPLLQLYFEQYRINEILSFFNTKMGEDLKQLLKEFKKDNPGPESIKQIIDDYMSQFEELRKVNVSLPKRNVENLSNRFGGMIEDLSKVDPIAAFTAGKLLNEFTLFQESEMPSFGESHNAYVSILEMMLSVYRADMESLSTLILRISRRVGVIQYFQTRRLLKAEEEGLSDGMKKAHAKIFNTAPNISLHGNVGK